MDAPPPPPPPPPPQQQQQQQWPPPYESLPQRQARIKRRRKDAPAEDADAAAEAVAAQPAASGDGVAAAAAAAGAAAAGPSGPPQPWHDPHGGASTSGGGGGGGGGAGEGPPLLSHIDVREYRTGAVGSNKFEYLDHTADVQIHSWGATLEEAFANAALGMFNYMTPLEGVALDPAAERTYEASGHDLHSLLYAFLDELLFSFSTELVVCREVEVTELDRGAWTVRAVGRGERFVRGRHEAGTEVKAITYSAMQVREAPGDCEVFVIVDI
ncbi:archease [Raphidocelis subcapitata]|uniref:Archease n=1 Tax=Raphidocelis subcapitata TaxID=307507 RepID=A0A2V0PG08_9CHLO|nr:archease [Raphidocelis subcapitata]|eukprot:GBF96833.1 archease [Raphidocelis subcapitata]